MQNLFEEFFSLAPSELNVQGLELASGLLDKIFSKTGGKLSKKDSGSVAVYFYKALALASQWLEALKCSSEGHETSSLLFVMLKRIYLALETYEHLVKLEPQSYSIEKILSNLSTKFLSLNTKKSLSLEFSQLLIKRLNALTNEEQSEDEFCKQLQNSLSLTSFSLDKFHLTKPLYLTNQSLCDKTSRSFDKTLLLLQFTSQINVLKAFHSADLLSSPSAINAVFGFIKNGIFKTALRADCLCFSLAFFKPYLEYIFKYLQTLASESSLPAQDLELYVGLNLYSFELYPKISGFEFGLYIDYVCRFGKTLSSEQMKNPPSHILSEISRFYLKFFVPLLSTSPPSINWRWVYALDQVLAWFLKINNKKDTTVEFLKNYAQVFSHAFSVDYKEKACHDRLLDFSRLYIDLTLFIFDPDKPLECLKHNYCDLGADDTPLKGKKRLESVKHIKWFVSKAIFQINTLKSKYKFEKTSLLKNYIYLTEFLYSNGAFLTTDHPLNTLESRSFFCDLIYLSLKALFEKKLTDCQLEKPLRSFYCAIQTLHQLSLTSLTPEDKGSDLSMKLVYSFHLLCFYFFNHPQLSFGISCQEYCFETGLSRLSEIFTAYPALVSSDNFNFLVKFLSLKYSCVPVKSLSIVVEHLSILFKNIHVNFSTYLANNSSLEAFIGKLVSGLDKCQNSSKHPIGFVGSGLESVIPKTWFEFESVVCFWPVVSFILKCIFCNCKSKLAFDWMYYIILQFNSSSNIDYLNDEFNLHVLLTCFYYGIALPWEIDQVCKLSELLKTLIQNIEGLHQKANCTKDLIANLSSSSREFYLGFSRLLFSLYCFYSKVPYKSSLVRSLDYLETFFENNGFPDESSVRSAPELGLIKDSLELVYNCLGTMFYMCYISGFLDTALSVFHLESLAYSLVSKAFKETQKSHFELTKSSVGFILNDLGLDFNNVKFQLLSSSYSSKAPSHSLESFYEAFTFFNAYFSKRDLEQSQVILEDIRSKILQCKSHLNTKWGIIVLIKYCYLNSFLSLYTQPHSLTFSLFHALHGLSLLQGLKNTNSKLGKSLDQNIAEFQEQSRYFYGTKQDFLTWEILVLFYRYFYILCKIYTGMGVFKEAAYYQTQGYKNIVKLNGQLVEGTIQNEGHFLNVFVICSGEVNCLANRFESVFKDLSLLNIHPQNDYVNCFLSKLQWSEYYRKTHQEKKALDLIKDPLELSETQLCKPLMDILNSVKLNHFEYLTYSGQVSQEQATVVPCEELCLKAPLLYKYSIDEFVIYTIHHVKKQLAELNLKPASKESWSHANPSVLSRKELVSSLELLDSLLIKSQAISPHLSWILCELSIEICFLICNESVHKLISLLDGRLAVGFKHEKRSSLNRLIFKNLPEKKPFSIHASSTLDTFANYLDFASRFSNESSAVRFFDKTAQTNERITSQNDNNYFSKKWYFSSVTSAFQKGYIEALSSSLPKDFIVILLSIDENKENLYLGRLSSQTQAYFCTIDITKPGKTFADLKSKFDEIIECNLKSTENQDSSVDSKAWWRRREDLNRKLQEWLEVVEENWLGIYKYWFYNDTKENKYVGKDRALYYFNLRTKIVKLFNKNSLLKKSSLETTEQQQQQKEEEEEVLNEFVLGVLIRIFHEPCINYKRKMIKQWIQWLSSLLNFVDIEVLSESKIIDEIIKAVERSSLCFENIENPFLESRNIRTSGSRVSCGQSHTILILDHFFHCFPLESLPCLKLCSCSRVPCLASLCELLETYPLGVVELDPSDGILYLLNLEGDLKSTQNKFEALLKSITNEKSFGLIDSKDSNVLENVKLNDYSIYLYFGHGTGEKFIKASTSYNSGSDGLYSNSKSSPLAFIMGCSSGTLSKSGDFEPVGLPWSFLLSNSPCIVANLWDITDKDIDRFSEVALKTWGLFNEEKNSKENTLGDITLPQAVRVARQACILPYLVGAAPVVHGLPACIITSRDKRRYENK